LRKLDGKLLVHVLVQVEDILLLGPLRSAARASSAATSTPAATSFAAASVASAPASDCVAVGHCVWCVCG
jgi:hypothetical protein